MNFTISSSDLNAQLQMLSKVLNSKNALPVLDNFLLDVKQGELKITANDGENVMNSTMPLEICEGEGDFIVPARTLLDAMRELPDQPLRFVIDPDTYAITITYHNGVYKFAGNSAADYPMSPKLTDGSTQVSISSAELVMALGRSVFATGQDELRPVMNGVYFDLVPDNLCIVATDGHKLVKTLCKNIAGGKNASFILPKKPALLLKNVLSKDPEKQVEMAFDARQAVITFDRSVLICRLIEGKYPNYMSVIPTSNPHVLRINRKDLMGGIRRILPFASESSQQVKFKITTQKMVLSSEDVDYAASATEELDCEYTGMEISIAFRGNIILDVLNNLESEIIEFYLADAGKPGLVIPAEQPEGEEVLMLVMPTLFNN